LRTHILRSLLFIIGIGLLHYTAFATITFDWNGTGNTDWTNKNNWTITANNGESLTGVNYPGESAARTTDIVQFGVVTGTYLNQPALSVNATVASVTFGRFQYVPAYVLTGTTLTGTIVTVNTGATLKILGDIVQNVNTNASGSIFNDMRGAGSITCTNIQIGSTASTSTTSFSFLISEVANLTVSNNVNINVNTNVIRGSGFRLENGIMTIGNQITFTNRISTTAANAAYFTINAITSYKVSNTVTNPTIILNTSPAIGNIPVPVTSCNFYGDHGGKATTIYKGVNPLIYTTSVQGFGPGGGVINSAAATAPIYDNLVIQGTGTAVVGGTTAGNPSYLNIDSTLITNSNVSFSNATNTATTIGVAGSTAATWTNNSPAVITGGSGTVDINGTLSNAGTMNMGTGALTISKDYTNTGTFTPNSAALITFDGATAQTLTDATNTGTNFYNVTFSNGSSTAVKTMKAGSKFTVAPRYTLTVNSSGVLTVGNQASAPTTALTLLSTSVGDASIADMTNGTINGSININRYVSGNLRRYMLLSSPVTNTTFGATAVKAYNLKPFIATTFITGPGGSSGGGFDDAPQTGNSPSVFIYDENSPVTANVNLVLNNEYKPFATTSDAVPIANGLLYYFRGSRNIINPFVTPFPASDNTVLNFFGSVFKGTGTNGAFTPNIINFPSAAPSTYDDSGTGMTAPATLSFNTGTPSVKRGLNLIGNPYASVLDLSLFYAANKGGTASTNYKFYYQLVKDTKTGANSSSTKFVVYDASSAATPPAGASRYIPSGQGFFVLAPAANSAITFNETMKAPYASYLATLSGGSANTNPVFNVIKPGSQSVVAKSRLKTSVSAVTNASTETTAAATTNATESTAETTPRLRLELMNDTIVHNTTDIAFTNNSNSKFINGEDAPYYQPSGQGDLLYTLSADSVGCFANYTTSLEKIKRINLIVTFSNYGLYKITSPFKQNIDDRYIIFLKDKYTNDSLDVVHNSMYTFNVDNNKASYTHDRFYLSIGIAPGHDYKLLGFSGSKQAAGVKLNWQTDNESNFTTFFIEKSSNNGETFTVIDSLQSTGVGNYNYTDVDQSSGQVIYRLKQKLVTNIISLSQNLIFNYLTTSTLRFVVYPSTTSQNININFGKTYSKSVKVNIVSSSGGLVRTVTASNTDSIQQNVGNLLHGLYVIEAVDESTGKKIGSGKFFKE
jgi:hypothetical protein